MALPLEADQKRVPGGDARSDEKGNDDGSRMAISDQLYLDVGRKDQV